MWEGLDPQNAAPFRARVVVFCHTFWSPRDQRLSAGLPDGTVLDGEIGIWRDGQVQPFALLQQRIGRKTVNARLLAEAPAVLVAYDLLEWRGEDWRSHAQSQRRIQLEEVVAHCGRPQLQISQLLHGEHWTDLDRQRAESRRLGVEGMIALKRRRRRGRHGSDSPASALVVLINQAGIPERVVQENRTLKEPTLDRRPSELLAERSIKWRLRVFFGPGGPIACVRSSKSASRDR
ncbi:MAG: hypothetical protein IT580_11690 [Verrucomicrobiales bacterium]|nr:hypothetical protein [Verrucomicrobiales bacterium]